MRKILFVQVLKNSNLKTRTRTLEVCVRQVRASSLQPPPPKKKKENVLSSLFIHFGDGAILELGPLSHTHTRARARESCTQICIEANTDKNMYRS